MTNGKTNNQLKFRDLFDKQKLNQSIMLEKGMYDAFKSESTNTIPVDDIKLMSYHIQQLMSEIGEILEADKRWKNFRNQKYDKDAKLSEIVDCFIVLMNIAMFSGFDAYEVAVAIDKKLDEVYERVATQKVCN